MPTLTPMYPNIKEIQDLITMSDQPTADITELFNAAYNRGYLDGKDFAKEKIIEAIKNER